MADEITRYKNRQKLQEQFVAIAEYVQSLLDKITQLKKENEQLEKENEQLKNKINCPMVNKCGMMESTK